jgi:hypothetical protein
MGHGCETDKLTTADAIQLDQISEAVRVGRATYATDNNAAGESRFCLATCPLRALEACVGRIGRAKCQEGFGVSEVVRRFLEAGARMRIVILTGVLLALSGCASYRDVTFIYYPNAPHRETFPRRSEFAAEAQKECAKYGMNAVYSWSTYADFQRVRVIYNCVQ